MPDNVVVTKVPCLRTNRTGKRLCPGSLTHERVPAGASISRYVCGHCGYIYGAREVEAIRRGLAGRTRPPQPFAAVQIEMFSEGQSPTDS